MAERFSQLVVTFLDKYQLIRSALSTFHDELAGMFELLRCRVEPLGFASQHYRQGDSRHCVQFYRPGWNNESGQGLHFELSVGPDDLQLGRLVLGLDLGDDLPGRHAIQAALCRILAPYQQTLLEKHSFNVRPQCMCKFLWSSLRLRELTVDKMVDKCRVLSEIGPLAEEALFLADAIPLWRTDCADPVRPSLFWDGANGGQQFEANSGLFGTPCIRIDGRARGNYCAFEDTPTNIMMLATTQGVQNGDGVYCSCIVRSELGGRIWFYGEGYHELPDGRREWPRLFCNPEWIEVVVPGRSGWQHVGTRVHANAPSDYDFTQQGVTLYFRTQTQDPNFLVNSIEFGRFRVAHSGGRL